ncbi:hypothetical protein NXF25_013865 [Crotalus adamanteus]|uniref:Bridge-like lipid transfer protein family member 1 C-terminal domain-containing protein n=1 Tax=Crotalus adamanteus TaxID=8729 RepID=A0AAW1B9J6_CROAD
MEGTVFQNTGLVPEETDESNEGETSNEDSKLQDLPPCWGLDIVCGKGTDFNYGPWVDRKRDCLWKFFFPPDYQVMKVTEVPVPGKPRQILAFELRMNIIADATIDLLFTKNRETNAVHVNVGAGSYLEVNIPMTVTENGYSPTIKGQLLHIDATSSMQFRTLLEAEMLAFHINAFYHRTWNMPQLWQTEVEVYKATYHFIYAQKNFFTDLIEDWCGDSSPDIYSFVPYTWNFKVMFHQFEMIWSANQHNWIDCSTKQQENVYVAACGETLNIVFSLPFLDFVPVTCSTRFSLRGDGLDLHLLLPDCHPSKYSLFMLVKDCHSSKLNPESCAPADSQSGQKLSKSKWRNMTQEEAGWVECWTIPSIMLTIDYVWHPIYPQKVKEHLIQSLSEMEETILSAQRPSQKMADGGTSSASSRLPVDLSELPPDKLRVELEISPDSQITFYGPLLKAFLSIKENYFGEDDMYTDFEEVISSPVLSMSTSSSSGWTAVGVDANKKERDTSLKQINPLTLRPWDITVLVNVYKVHGRLPVHCSSDGPECPTGFLERLCFEMKKGYKETMLQLVLSPLNIFLNDSYQRPTVDEVLREGHVSLSGLQLRAHAMFSAEGLPVDSDTLEYAWLIDIQTGSLTAKVTVPQLVCLFEWGQTFVFHVACREFQLERPKSVILCQHGIDRRFCEAKMSCISGPCLTSDELKYTMIRLAVDGADVYAVEHGCATNIKMGAVRIASCNLHNQSVGEGISAAIQDFQIRQYIEQANNCQTSLQPAVLRRAYWLEAGSINFGLITADVALAADRYSKHQAQRRFLETHDSRTKRLWFLWPDDNTKNKRSKNKCGCLGGCRFFGGPGSGLDFFKFEELTPSSSSAFSNASAESDMFYGQSLLQPGEWIITKELPKIPDGKANGVKTKEWECRTVGTESERKSQQLNLQVPLRSHSSSSSSEENSSSSAALPLLAGDRESPSSAMEDHLGQKALLIGSKKEDAHGSSAAEGPANSPVSPNLQEKPIGQSPLRSPLKRQESVCSGRLGSTKSLTAAFYGDKQPVPVGVQFSSDVSRSDENVLDSPKQRRSFGSFPYTPSADSNSFHQYRSMDSSMSMADSEAYFSAAEDFEPISSDEGPGTYPGRKKKRKQAKQIDYGRGSMPLDLDTPTSEESSSYFEQLSVPTFKIVKQGLKANALLDRGMQLTGSTSNTPYTPLEKKILDNTDDETVTEEWTLDHPVCHTRTTAIVEVKGTVDIVLSPLVAEVLDRYIEAMVHCASTRHAASIVDDLHCKVLREAIQNRKTSFSENLSSKQDVRGTKIETPATGTTQVKTQANVSLKQDKVTIKGLQANVTVPKVNLCLLQASIEESLGTATTKNVTHFSLVALCFDRIATQFRMNRGLVEENINSAETGRGSVTFEKYVHSNKMQPQSSGSLRSNAGIEKGKEIAAKLNIHRIHGQLRGLDTSDMGICAITAIPFEKSKVLFTLEELDDFSFVDETDHQVVQDVTRIGPSQEKWGWIMFECGIENLTIKGGRQCGAVLYNAFGNISKSVAANRGGFLASNNSSDSPTGSGYNTDVSEEILHCDGISAGSDTRSNSVSDEQDEGVESDELKKEHPLRPPPPDSCSMKLTIKEIWFSFAAPTNVRSPAHIFSRQLNLLSTATPAIGAWLVPIDQVKSSLNKLETEGTLRVCAVMGCIMTEALENKSVHFPLRSKYNKLTRLSRYLQENPSCLLCNILHHYLHQATFSIIEEATMSDGLPALVTLKKGLIALARQWMKFIVVTPAFKGVSLHRPTQPIKLQSTVHQEQENGFGLDNVGGLQSDTSADGAEFEFDAATVSEHTMLLEGSGTRPPPPAGPVTGAEIMRKLSKTHTHSDSGLKIKGIHPYHSLSYTSGDTATDSPVHVGRSGQLVKESPRKESLLSYLTGSFPSLHNLLEGTPQRSTNVPKSSSLTRTANTMQSEIISEHPLLTEPSSVSFYNWMSNAVGNRGNIAQESPVTKAGHSSLPTGVAPNLPTIPSASDFNTVMSSDQNTLDGTHSQHSTSQDDIVGIEEANQGLPAVQLADAQVVFKPLLSHTGIQPQDVVPLCYRMYFGEHLSFSGTLDCLRADIVDSDTAKERRSKRAQRQGLVNLPPLEFKPALMLETFNPTGILEKSSETFYPAGIRSPTEPACKVAFENEQDSNSLSRPQRKRSLVISEPQHVTLIIFGIGMVNRTHLEADIGGLTMESELKRIHGSFTLKEKMKDVLHQKMTETSATAHIGGVNIVLLEGITPNIQLEDFPTSPTSTAKQEFLTVVKCSIAKSQALYSAQRGVKTNNAAIFKVGAVSINIPQHPATLHSMMVRSSHQLSKQISDLIRQPSAVTQPPKEDIATPLPAEKTPTSVNQTPVETNEFPQLPEGLEKKPIVLKFSAMIDGIAIGAALLPSLKAEYKMGRMRSHGMTGAQTRFTFELPNHKLRFTSKVSATDMSTIPPSASLNLPPVTMSGKYIMEEHDTYSDQIWSIDELPAKQGYYVQGNYLRCVAEVGSFEHNLSTDLLNHLVFVQKVFMKEVNEVIQKVSGGEQPIPLWNEHDGTNDGEKPKILLYSLSLQFKGIQVTATTPSMWAVRFETGLIELELSNRIQAKAMPGGTSYLKLFCKCQVDLNLALGQIIKHQVYEEAGSDFHQVAYFKTRIGLRNALREEINGSSDRETVLITLNRPIVFAQPVAFDRAVLFWLNYKAAYDNWNEQRMALNKDIHRATKEIVDMLPGIQQTSAQAFGTLFLQLTVNDLGICLPITNTPQTTHTTDLDTGSALVLTIESTLITACSSESLVSKGHFKNFCIRFADGFETSWDDWKPEIRGELVMNACVVPDGTYEVCSRTTGQAAAESNSAGTWTLNVLWKMCGIDVHMDPNIGKRLNALGNTLTTLTGEEDLDDIADLNSVNIADLSDEDEIDTMSPTVSMRSDGGSLYGDICKLTLGQRIVNHLLGLSPKSQRYSVPVEYLENADHRRQGPSNNQTGEQRGRKYVKRLVDIRELNEQAKVIDDLRKLGASEGTINQEIQRYQQLESVAVNDIRRDVRKKLRRSSMRAASLKDKWGLGYKPSYSRSKGISASGRPPLKRMDRTRLGESEEVPEICVDGPSAGSRVIFNLQDMPEEGRRDDSLSSSSEDSEKEEDHDRERPYVYRKALTARKKATGFAAVHQLFTERWPTSPANRSVTGTTTERNIDFELDVRVEIDSGKCVLHPTTLQQEHDDISLRRTYDRSSRSLDQDSPSKKRKFQTNYASTTHLLAGKKVPASLQTKTSDVETTVFYIPGVDVKLHYNSKMLKTESPNTSRGSSLQRTFSKESKLYSMKDAIPPTRIKAKTLLTPQPPPIPSAKGKGSGGIKTAKLYAWVALQSLPEEMVISPCLLDFLEKALETIPITPIERNYTAISSQDEDIGQFDMQDPLEESTASLVSSSTSAYSSFPVDVVVYVRVQPSQIKFSCLPVSRVECMLKLPSLDLVFSSNRGELETLGSTGPTENSLQSGSKMPIKTISPGSSLGLGSSFGRTRHSSSQSDLTGSSNSSSGLSFTACMSDFSLYVFHPYGAGKQKTTVAGLSSGTGNIDEEPSSVTGRKDSLSINLEFVKVSLSRIRRSGGATFFETLSASKSANKMETTLINISAVCDIGSASFKYDMRRLSEILAFPRAWYRRSIARRLFLGDQTINMPVTSGPGTPDSVEGMNQHTSPESSRKAYCRTWEQPSQSVSFTHMAQSPSVFNEHSTNSNMASGTVSHNLKSPAVSRSRSVSDSSVPQKDLLSKTSTPFNKSNKAGSQQVTPWETLVVFAMNLKQLNVQMNMSNVMGNTTWTTSGLKSQGRLSVGSNRDREISMSVGLGRSHLDSRGGVVGGTIDVNALEMVAHISEHPNQQPNHKIQITMGSTEARVDYMGSSILMGIFSNADLKLQDEWKVNLYNTLDSSITDKSEIFVHGDLKWDIFQVMISRSTTPDLIKIGMKLQEFFTQQFDTSKRALSTWGPVPYFPSKTVVSNVEKCSQQLLDAAHHRHWPGVLKVMSGCHISLFQFPLPEDGKFGGSMSLHGNHMTLACFHGPNFRSKSWALFHLEEPNIAFWTEAQKIWQEGSSEHSTYVVQTLDFHLGHNTMVTKPCGALQSPMATITKITRRRHENPPHGVASVKEWFNYVTATRNEELNLLRNVDANNTEHTTTVKSSSLLSGFRGGSSYNHETETIFALPRMQLDFKSIHVQQPQEPLIHDANAKPKVECSVVTEFTDHICVTMDAELIMFLHDLVSAYLKEKEKAVFPPRALFSRPGQKSPISVLDQNSSEKELEESVTYTTVDWREFICNTWHLEPTLRLISWTGRKIDPVAGGNPYSKKGRSDKIVLSFANDREEGTCSTKPLVSTRHPNQRAAAQEPLKRRAEEEDKTPEVRKDGK